ncbi:MAG: peptide ABC transporter substrate-binding protein [Firmicutes bacterium]|nr:peptide ABC transporter substrate-binding protein [Bacillota bacterium]
MQRRFFTVLVMSLVVMALAIPGLAATTSKGPALAAEQYVRFNAGAEPQYMDPARSTGVPEGHVQLALFEGLTRLDKNDRPIPGIAKSWVISKDGKTITFYLRPSKWSDGTPLTAYDFEYSWKRALSPELASEYAYQLYYLKNGAAYNAGKAKASDVGVKAINALTLKVELEAPCSYFLSLCAFHTLYPVKKSVVEKYGEKWAQDPKTFVSNGPFKMVAWKHNSYIDVVKNPYYWDAASVKIQKIRFTLVENESTLLTMYDTGVIDMTDTVPVAEIDRLRKEGQLKIAPYLGTYYYQFNVTKPPLDNVKVRKALALAINRQAIVENITKAGQVPALAFTPPGVPDVPGAKGDFRTVGGNFYKDNDVETAKKLLAEAGYPDGKGFPTIEILYNTSEAHKAIAEAIQEMWKKNLGINVTLTNQEWGVYLSNRTALKYQVARAGWIGDYVDAMTFLDMWVTGGGNNDTGWSNKQYDALIEKAKTSGDPKVRIKAMHDAEKILMDEMPICPIYFYTRPYLQQDYLKDVTHSTIGMVDFKWAYIVKH